MGTVGAFAPRTPGKRGSLTPRPRSPPPACRWSESSAVVLESFRYAWDAAVGLFLLTGTAPLWLEMMLL